MKLPLKDASVVLVHGDHAPLVTAPSVVVDLIREALGSL